MNNEMPETKSSKKKSDDCIELKNIKYQTMLINNNMKVTDISTAHIDHINTFLNQEKEFNKTLPWSKLGSGTKMKKINEYIDVFSNKNNYSKIQKKNLQLYLKKSMDRKKLQRARDVNYDISAGKIISIPGLIYNKDRNKFTLKNLDKKGSTLKNLAPKRRKKKKKTSKNTTNE